MARGTFTSMGKKTTEKMAQIEPASASLHLLLFRAKIPPTMATIPVAIAIVNAAAMTAPRPDSVPIGSHPSAITSRTATATHWLTARIPETIARTPAALVFHVLTCIALSSRTPQLVQVSVRGVVGAPHSGQKLVPAMGLAPQFMQDSGVPASSFPQLLGIFFALMFYH